MRFIMTTTGDNADEISELLPKETLTSQIVQPAIERYLYPALTKALKEEIEIYKAIPKALTEKAKEEIKTFDTRHNNTCFMGKGFGYNKHIISAPLGEYRKRVGTINHPVWGECTLLEIWGGDHFESHQKNGKRCL